jgi:predicted metal-dependent hydrolase
MSASSPNLRVRRMQFEFPDDVKAHWNPAKPELSQVINACSLLMPYLEPFLIESIRMSLPHLPTEALRDEATKYIGQEANHFRQHRRYNDLILQQGYESLKAYEAQLADDYKRMRATKSMRYRLGYAAGFETMALAIGHMLVKHREFFFKGADPAVSSLVLWHFVEELEHKTSAYNVYQAIYGKGLRGYLYRIYSGLSSNIHTLLRTRVAVLKLMEIDGMDKDPQAIKAFRKLTLKIFLWSLPKMLDGLMPWHKPERIKDPAWMAAWIEMYDASSASMAMLDTSQLSQPIPVPLVETTA